MFSPKKPSSSSPPSNQHPQEMEKDETHTSSLKEKDPPLRKVEYHRTQNK